ncbi:MAG: arginine--tRNA ligase [Chloroflexi bacterium]|nr:arginine--tRNA ligase [Chloroflexota bacterium]
MAIKDKIEEMVRLAFQEAQDRGLLPQVTLPETIVERPQNPEHGDYAVTAPLKLARAARMNPLAIAQCLVDLLKPSEEIDAITLVPPGFINFSLKEEWVKKQVDVILQEGQAYGDLTVGAGEKVQVEYVSVNPTGPLHVGHGRGAVLGSALARILKAAGYAVEEEYYINDAGTQMDSFYRSLHARYLQELGVEAEMPAEGYMGQYMVDLAQEIISEEGDRFKEMEPEEAVKGLGAIGLEKMLASIRRDLESIGVVQDVWFSEQSLFDSGQYDEAMKALSSGGYTQEKEGATWFVSTALGEDKDNVLIRSSGRPTYFASDIAYHYNKFLRRGFDRVINIWGADHQGHISRMKTAVGALGIDPDRLRILVAQMVTLKRGQEVVKLSKRSGDIITLREVVEEVGADPCRFFFLARSADSQMDFDLELAKKQSADNPAYYVQYAHARICSILRLAEERGIDYEGGDVSLLGHESELTLVREMLKLPETMELIVETLEPQHLPYYSQDLATHFHSFYEKCRVVTEDQGLTKARLKLVKAAQTVLAKCLDLMGMATPERM